MGSKKLRSIFESVKASVAYYQEINERKFKIFTNGGIPEDRFRLYHDLRRLSIAIENEKVDALRAGQKHALLQNAYFIIKIEADFPWLRSKWDEVFGGK